MFLGLKKYTIFYSLIKYIYNLGIKMMKLKL